MQPARIPNGPSQVSTNRANTQDKCYDELEKHLTSAQAHRLDKQCSVEEFTQIIQPFGNLNNYPISNSEYPFLDLDPTRSYIFFVDRLYLDHDCALDRTYSEYMFDNDTTGLDQYVYSNYVQSCIDGFHFISDKSCEFENIVALNRILRESGEDEIDDQKLFSISQDELTINGISFSFVYMGTLPGHSDYIPKLQQYFSLINKQGQQPLGRVVNNHVSHYFIPWGDAQFATRSCPNEYKGTVCSYESVAQIKEIYQEYHSDFEHMLERAADNENKKIAAILVFISRFELAHFFKEANCRTAAQIVLNKLLKENNLKPSILAIPNGIAQYVVNAIACLGEETPIREMDLDRLCEVLSVPIAAVREGQEFYEKVQLPVATFIDTQSGATVKSRTWTGSGAKVVANGTIEMGDFANGVLSAENRTRFTGVSELYKHAIGLIRQKEFLQAINLLELALKIYKTSNHYAFANVYSCLVSCYRDLGDTDTARLYCEKALASCEKLDSSKAENITLRDKIIEKQTALEKV